jgi:uncharacterized membrane protein
VTQLPHIAACLWLITANLIAMFPSRDHHRRNAYKLMALGLPLTLWLAQTLGTSVTVIFLACACSILRWPVYFAWKWLRAKATVSHLFCELLRTK